MHIRYLILFLAIFSSGIVNAQKQGMVDSLKAVLKATTNDTDKVNLMNRIGSKFVNSDLEKAQEFAEKALALASKINYKEGKVNSYNTLGNKCYLGGDFDCALQNYLNGLKIMEELGDKKGIANSLMGIGNVYSIQKKHELALEYQKRSLKIRKELGETAKMAWNYNNIGAIYSDMKDYYAALEYQLKGLKIKEEHGTYEELSSSYGNIGNIYTQLGNYKKALEYLQKAYEIRKELNNKKGMVMSFTDMGKVYEKQGEKTRALNSYKKGLALAKEVGFKEGILNTYHAISNIYEKKGQHARALNNYKLYMQVKDSVYNVESSAQIAEMQARFDTEKKQKEIQLQKNEILLKDEEIARKRAEIEKQNTRKYAFMGAIGMVLLLAFVIYNRYRVKQKANKLLEKQNQEIAEKNKEITDSINYARKIQDAILPEPHYLQSLLPEHFIFYKPRDIVSGDFYWAAEKKGKTIFTVADCTGHGVPGAFMSMIGSSLLNEIVIEKGVTAADDILNELKNNIIRSLKQKENEAAAKVGKSASETPVSIKDGMDMALCVWDKKNGRLEFSGAKNPLFLLREKTSGEENLPAPVLSEGKLDLYEFKGDNQPVGFQRKKDGPFSKKTIQLQKGDTVYMLSDGYTDQFGGDNGKKFRQKHFKELVLSIQHLSLSEQLNVFDSTLKDWQGDFRQIDDICIMGVRF